tara:strand:+ start:329 stop:604 length:276 start_codon:yes stop_codon:yes gene_type:complete
MIFSNLIPHGNYPGLPPEGQLLAIIIGLLAVLIGYGLYVTFGEGSKELVDQIDEHAKMHELGIAHGHEGKRAMMTTADKDYPKHSHDEKLK